MLYSNVPVSDNKPLPPLAPKPRAKPNYSTLPPSASAHVGASGRYATTHPTIESPELEDMPQSASPFEPLTVPGSPPAEPMFSLQAMHVASGFHPMSLTSHAAHVAGWGVSQQQQPQFLSPYTSQAQAPGVGSWNAPSPTIATIESRGAQLGMGAPGTGTERFQNKLDMEVGEKRIGGSPHVAFRTLPSQRSFAPVSPTQDFGFATAPAELRPLSGSTQKQIGADVEEKRELLMEITTADEVEMTGTRTGHQSQDATFPDIGENGLKPAPCIAIGMAETQTEPIGINAIMPPLIDIIQVIFFIVLYCGIVIYLVK